MVLGLAAGALLLSATGHVRAEAQLLIEASTGKVLHAENATYPWYPASVTKLMTAYTTLRAVKEGKIALNTLLPISRNAAAQQPTKMGFKVGTNVTVDNALKMLMVKSANDIAVAIAEGVGGSITGFADLMNANARRLGMSQSNFVNPNGLPAENHISSARDLGILARALIREFPEYDSYWHISSIRYGNRVMRNYNSLIDRYPGRRRHEDRIHLRVGLQRRRLRHTQWPPADRGDPRIMVRRCACAKGGAAPRARI